MGFELDEILYKKALHFFKKRKQHNAEVLGRLVTLVEIKPRLTLISRAICGVPIDIFPAEREGGYKDDNFFLPAESVLFSTKEENTQFYIFRVIYLCVQKQLKLNWDNGMYVEEQASQKAIETSPLILSQLFREYPSLLDWYDRLFLQLPINKKSQQKDSSWLYGKWMENSKGSKKSKQLKNFDEAAAKIQNPLVATTTLQAKAVEAIESVAIDKKQQEDNIVFHNFEKIESAEEFNGNWKDFDGKDELNDHHEALQGMNLRHTVRVDDTVHSVYQADFIENISIAESAEVDEKGFHLTYDEWDYKKRIYLTNYCKVYPKTQQMADAEYYRRTMAKYKTTLNGLRKMLTSVNNRLQQQRRLLQGESFDLDALTDLYTDMHLGVSPDERIYLSRRKKEKDIAIVLLLDISLSSDGYAAGNRVIDVEKEVSILFGEILHEFDIHFAIDGFYSKTRNYSTYLTLKDFNDDWQAAKYKIGAAAPGGYTRIGPALRHAGARLSCTDARNKWVILLSDGKPNDYDKYEGRHGIYDIKQALTELNENNVNSYALAIEARAKYYLPQMFGQNHYQILTSPEALLTSLAKLFEKIKHT